MLRLGRAEEEEGELTKVTECITASKSFLLLCLLVSISKNLGHKLTGISLYSQEDKINMST